MLDDDKTPLENDDCVKWGAGDITKHMVGNDLTIEEAGCDKFANICRANNFLYNESKEAARERVKEMMKKNEQKLENQKSWASFYFKWKMLKQFSTKMHWVMLYYDFIVGLFLVLIVLDFNVKSYHKVNVSVNYVMKQSWTR